MPAKIVVGMQFGDEGKGKLVDCFAEDDKGRLLLLNQLGFESSICSL